MHPHVNGLTFRPALLAAGVTDDELRRLRRERRLAVVRPGAYVSADDARLDPAGLLGEFAPDALVAVERVVVVELVRPERAGLAGQALRALAEPRDEPYGRVVVFEDLYGNRWDLVQPLTPPPR